MSDNLEARGHHAITHDGATYIKLADASVTFSLCQKELAAKDAEITRLRAELDTALRDGMKEAASLCDELPNHQGGICAIAIRMMIDEEDKKAAIRAAAKDDRPSEEIIREDRDAWPDRQANDPIRAAAKEEK